MKQYKAIIVDDEADNISLIDIYLKKYCPNVVMVASATNVSDAINAFIEHNPDLLLLDINLGKEDVFLFLDSIINTKSEVVFISSYSEYGVKAVNYNVTGYIMKPIEIEKFKSIINKAIFNIETKNKERTYIPHPNNTTNYPPIVAIPDTDRVNLLHTDFIVYLESDGRYTIFYLTNGSTKIASKNLGEYEKLLNPDNFFRIHHRILKFCNPEKKHQGLAYGSDSNHCPEQEQIISEKIESTKAIVKTKFVNKKFSFITHDYEYHFTLSDNKWILEELYLVDDDGKYKSL